MGCSRKDHRVEQRTVINSVFVVTLGQTAFTLNYGKHEWLFER